MNVKPWIIEEILSMVKRRLQIENIYIGSGDIYV